ncbi:universal stress protein [Ralstonia pseudosolanacearum]|uniref:universal stress protein n=1 Tax=Ralstonia pseudosolanacearum TaxID=1310165 RepID=UPI000B92EB4A|nr:universal stress protein [Ralstonia pseudosolanacearum]MCD9231640.1 universal stress protein [Ralstonia pseudosolanacearum]
MFTHILLPTDGSSQCTKAIDGALKLAHAAGCRLTAYTCIEDFPSMAYSGGAGECPYSHYMEQVQGYAKGCIDRIAERAREEGVEFDSDVTQFAEPYLGILDAARRHACDVIFMASHGHRSLTGRLLIGNETRKVLTYAHIPVVVYR